MLIVKGKYVHYENGVANGISEQWQVGNNNSPNPLMIITYNTPAYELMSEVLYSEHKAPQIFQYHTDSQDITGHYRIENNKLLVSRDLPPNIHLEDTLVWSDNAILDLPFLSTKGRTILHLDKYGTAPVFAPHLRSGDRAGDLAKKTVQNMGEDTVTIGDKSYHATKYRYGHLYWLDDYGVVLRIEADNYEMVLTEYSRFDSKL